MNNLLNLRKNAGLTQKELADKLGVGSNTISQYELGKRKPDILKLSRLAIILDCSVDDLLADIKKRDTENFLAEPSISQSHKVT